MRQVPSGVGASEEEEKPPQFAEGLTIPHYYRPLMGSPWALAIWLGVYSPRTRRLGPDARIMGGRLWVRTSEARGQRAASPPGSPTQTPHHLLPIAARERKRNVPSGP